MSTIGAFSLAASRQDKSAWMVRARHNQDLENLKKLTGIRRKTLRSENTDYPFRLIVNKDELYRITTSLTATVDYPNFKSEVAKRPDQRNKISAYHKIWDALMETQVVKSLYSMRVARVQDVDEGRAQPESLPESLPGLWNHGRELARRGTASLQDAIVLHDGPPDDDGFTESDQAYWDDLDAEIQSQEPGYMEVGNY